MTASELRRKLLYCGHTDVTDYLKDSPLNRYIYKQLLDLRSQHNIDTPILTIFNEVYYQCVNIQNDRMPGFDVKKRFFDEEKKYLDFEEDAAILVFSIVRTIFRTRKECLNFEEECFWKQFSSLEISSKYQDEMERLLSFMRKEGFVAPERLPVMHVPFEEFPQEPVSDVDAPDRFIFHVLLRKDGLVSSNEYTNAFAKITDNFSPKSIQWLLDLYLRSYEKEALLKCIENVCPDYYKRKKKIDFEGMYKEIDKHPDLPPSHEGRLPYIVVEKDFSDVKYEATSWVEENTNGEGAKTAAKSENVVIEQYKQECEALRCQLDNQRMTYEAKMAEREQVYQAELEAMRKELIAKYKATIAKQIEVKPAPPAKEEPKAFSLTVAEMSEYVKKFFDEQGAKQFIIMYYHFAMKYDKVYGDTSKLMDEIIPAIQQRHVLQTNIDINTAHQVNIGPQKVINQTKEDEK